MKLALRPGHRNSAGFTLIEISVVVLIIALMVTTATVRLDTYLPTSRGEAAARDILGTLDLARISAIAYGREYSVEFDLDEQQFRILTPLDEEGRLARTPEDRVALQWKILPSGVHIGGILKNTGQLVEAGTFQVRYSALGASDNFYIYLENDAGEGYTLTLRVVALTGHSKVSQGRETPAPVGDDDF